MPPPADDGDSHAWFRRSTRREREMGERLAARGMTSWHQTPEQYFAVIRRRMFRDAVFGVLAALAWLFLRSLG